MNKHEKEIMGGFTAEPIYRYDNICGFIVYWAGEEYAHFGLRHSGIIRADNAPAISESAEEYVHSFFGIVNRESNAGNLAAWWESFDRFAHDPFWY